MIQCALNLRTFNVSIESKEKILCAFESKKIQYIESSEIQCALYQHFGTFSEALLVILAPIHLGSSN
jgi:hypothetical protein